MHVVFDLDGVVIDTESVVSRCYQMAGATPPPSILAHENSDWLIHQCNGDQRAAGRIKLLKNTFYRNVLRAGVVEWLAGAFTASELHAEGHRIHLLSGAPSGTISIIRELWTSSFPHRPWPFSLTSDGMKTVDKMKTIRLIAERASDNRGAYVDDQDKFIDLPDSWRFVHFTNELDHVGRLLGKILREEGTTT